MFCVHCGKEISEESKFCPYCGASIPVQGDGLQVRAESNAEETGISGNVSYSGSGAQTNNNSFLSTILLVSTLVTAVGFFLPIIRMDINAMGIDVNALANSGNSFSIFQFLITAPSIQAMFEAVNIEFPFLLIVACLSVGMLLSLLLGIFSLVKTLVYKDKQKAESYAIGAVICGGIGLAVLWIGVAMLNSKYGVNTWYGYDFSFGLKMSALVYILPVSYILTLVLSISSAGRSATA
jgi:RNA polymerase subunit RPABC4/transcription elongation factor Spt4